MVATRLLDPWTFQHGVSIGWWLGASDTTMAIIIQKNKKNPCSSKSFEKVMHLFSNVQHVVHS